MSKNGKIAELVLRAQTASDGGKGINETVRSKRSRRDNFAGYPAKDKFVYMAVEMIATGGSGFRYAVAADREGVARYLVYFETRIGDKKYQVSFHSFDRRLEKYLRKSFRIKWDGRCSRESAAMIYRHYVPGGRYTWK